MIVLCDEVGYLLSQQGVKGPNHSLLLHLRLKLYLLIKYRSRTLVRNYL